MATTERSVTGLTASAGRHRITFGLVSVAVGLRPLVASPLGKSRPAGTTLCPEHKEKLKQGDFVCPQGHTVPRGEEVKGYLWNGEYVIVSKEEMAQAEQAGDGEIHLRSLLPDGEIDPMFVDASFEVFPLDAGAMMPYKILLMQLEQRSCYMLGTMVHGGTTKAFAMRAHDGAIIGCTLHHMDNIKSDELGKIAEAVKEAPDPSKALMEQANVIFDNTPTDFRFEKVPDEKGERMWQIIAEKAEKGSVEQKPAEVIELQAEDDLMRALKATAKTVRAQASAKAKKEKAGRKKQAA